MLFQFDDQFSSSIIQFIFVLHKLLNTLSRHLFKSAFLYSQMSHCVHCVFFKYNYVLSNVSVLNKWEKDRKYNILLMKEFVNVRICHLKCSFYCWLSDTMAWRTTNITFFVCVWKEFTVNSILFYVYVSTYMYMWIHVRYTNFHVSSGCLFVFCNYWRHFIRKEPHPPLSFFYITE